MPCTVNDWFGEWFVDHVNRYDCPHPPWPDPGSGVLEMMIGTWRRMLNRIGCTYDEADDASESLIVDERMRFRNWHFPLIIAHIEARRAEKAQLKGEAHAEGQ